MSWRWNFENSKLSKEFIKPWDKFFKQLDSKLIRLISELVIWRKAQFFKRNKKYVPRSSFTIWWNKLKHLYRSILRLSYKYSAVLESGTYLRARHLLWVRLICFYPKDSTLESFDDFFLTESSDKKKSQKILP